MKKIHFGCVFIVLTAFSLRGAEFKFGHQTLKVPDGFEIELVSTTNLVKRPVSMDFDELGRLYVTDSSGSSEKGPTQYEKKDHRVMRLEDTDGDGKFDKSVVFADNMMFPEGCLWYDGSVYVAAPPSIWKLTDTNNDGIADVRVEWHEGKTLTGCANDLHGPYLGRDGWIYWCKGAFAEQTYEVNGKPFTTKASHIFRARPDRSRIEPVLTGGMDNPVWVAFSREGERFLAGTFFEPHIPGMRDGVIHAIYGGVYGKPHPDVLDSHKKTGDLMPVMTHLGASASCDLIFYESKIFGDDFQNNMLVCNFNLHNITRHVLTPDGATFKTKDSVFLSCENDPDFHPTCVKEDADGSLLVIDTGGWYKICCPTSQLYKPDVLGAIYRIRKTGAPKVEDGRGLKIDWVKARPSELTGFLDDNRPFVVTRAIHELAKRKGESIPALREVLGSASNFVDARRNAVWALTQIDSKEARHALYLAFPDVNSPLRADDTVAQTAFHSISLWRDWESVWGGDEAFRATIALSAAGQSQNHAMRRIAAEVWGRIGDKQKDFAARNLLRIALDGPEDRVLEHSIIYGLIEVNDPKTTAEGLTGSELIRNPSNATKRIALIALDQMDAGGLKPEQVTPLLSSSDPNLKQTASWIIGHHPEWGGALAGFFREQLSAKTLSTDAGAELKDRLAHFAHDASVQNLLTESLQKDSSAARLIALRAVAQAGLKETPAAWASEVTRILAGTSHETVHEAVLAARALSPKSKELSAALDKVASDPTFPDEARLTALAAGPNGATIEKSLFDFSIAQIVPEKPVIIRGLATTILTKAKLSEEQLLAVSEALKGAGPMELNRLLGAFEKSTNEKVGMKLVGDLQGATMVSSLRPDRLKPLFAKYPESVRKKSEALIASLDVDAAEQSAHLDKLMTTLKGGDVRRGQMVFNSSKAACSSCHQIGYLGGRVGPDLTSIGKTRSERDLLEAVVYPNASFVRSYESMIVATKAGEDYSGIVKKDSPDELILVTGPNSEVTIARNDITEMRPGTTSVMPGGMADQLTGEELADLIAFLKNTQW